MVHLTMEVAFLIAISSSRWFRELEVPRVGPPCVMFCEEKVLWPHPRSISKAVSKFHMSQVIHLPVFFFRTPYASVEERWLHSLDIQRALAFYLQRTKDFRKTPKLFISIAEWSSYIGQEAFKMDLCCSLLPTNLCCPSGTPLVGEGSFH